MVTRTQFGLWTLAFLSFPIGGLVAVALVGELETPIEGIIGGIGAGIVIGAAQWAALRTVLHPGWIIATALGMGAGVGAGVAIFGSATTVEAIVQRALVTGLLLAVAQWIVLRNRKNAVLWIPTVWVSYVVGWLVTTVVIQQNVQQGFTVFGASGALTFQVLTGLVLAWLLRSR